MQLQLSTDNNNSVMFVRIIGINTKYLMPLNPTPYSLLPTPYSQGNVARLFINGISTYAKLITHPTDSLLPVACCLSQIGNLFCTTTYKNWLRHFSILFAECSCRKNPFYS